MAVYLLRRALIAALLLLGVATVTFVLIHAAPGDPADLYLAKEMTPQARAAAVVGFNLVGDGLRDALEPNTIPGTCPQGSRWGMSTGSAASATS